MPEPQTSAPDTSLGIGLTRAEAAHRLATDGPNELASQGPRGVTRIIREVLTEPMFLLLIAAAAIYVVLGDVREASVLAASIFVVVSDHRSCRSAARSTRWRDCEICRARGRS